MTTLNIRIDEKLKKQAAKTFASLGMDTSSAVKMFLTQTVIEKGLPFTPTQDPAKIRAKWDREVVQALKISKSYKTGTEALADL